MRSWHVSTQPSARRSLRTALAVRRVLQRTASVGVAAVTVLLTAAILFSLWTPRRITAGAPEQKQLDPAAWGSDHVDDLVPMYTEGGECLFCHRHQVGVTWDTNKHNRTIRDAEPTEPAVESLRADDNTKAIAEEVTLLMGDTRAQRFLKRAEAYGHADMLTTMATFGRGRARGLRAPRMRTGTPKRLPPRAPVAMRRRSIRRRTRLPPCRSIVTPVTATPRSSTPTTRR